jgi:catechol 2,3-dioxygenase-like lactoylglutathione lyase family enzyme
MKLGAFSISLAVKDIEKSKLFYEKLGFIQIGGEQSQGWLILRNDDHTIGLFQGMFENNIMTFNPGWDKDCNALDAFDDVRKLHKEFKDSGIEMSQESISGDSGPSSFSIIDPDGNAILFDQHV